MDGQIAHGGMRQVQLQGLPGIAIVERNVDGSFRAGKKQTLARGIFTNGVDRGVVSNPGDDFLPVSAEIACAVDVRLQVVEAESIDGGVSCSGVEVRSFQNGNLSPGSQLRGSHIFTVGSS